MKYMKQLSYAFTVYLVLFFIDYIVTLFSIDHTQIVTNFLGLRINMYMTQKEVSTIFSLTPRVLVTFLCFVCIWEFIYFVVNKIKK